MACHTCQTRTLCWRSIRTRPPVEQCQGGMLMVSTIPLQSAEQMSSNVQAEATFLRLVWDNIFASCIQSLAVSICEFLWFSGDPISHHLTEHSQSASDLSQLPGRNHLFAGREAGPELRGGQRFRRAFGECWVGRALGRAMLQMTLVI